MYRLYATEKLNQINKKLYGLHKTTLFKELDIFLSV